MPMQDKSVRVPIAHELETPDCSEQGLDCMASIFLVPAGSPSCGGDVTVYVLDIGQPSLPTPFILFLCLFLSLWHFQQYFIAFFFPDNSPLSHSVLPVLFPPYWSFQLHDSL